MIVRTYLSIKKGGRLCVGICVRLGKERSKTKYAGIDNPTLIARVYEGVTCGHTR